jgi:acyl-CoA synthetase (NDP forming)
MLGKFDARFRFNMLTSQGQEINGSVADYMDYALELHTTRVLALFLEAVRDPERFLEVLAKAQARDIPVVVTKVGRTARSAFLATTHSGAIAGSDSAFDAVCDRYGVLRTDDLDGLAATAQIFALGQRAGPGEFGAILDSGGLREQLIDMAEDMGVPLADLTPETTAKLRQRLPHMLEAVNPLDAAGPLREDYNDIIIDCVGHVTGDPNIAIVGHEIYITDHVSEDSPQADAATEMAERYGKPFFIFNSFSTVPNTGVGARLMEDGVPLINGLRPMLTAVRHAFAYRDRAATTSSAPEPADPVVTATWHSRLTGDHALGEADALELMRDFGLPVVETSLCEDLVGAQEAARHLGFPVVMKTAEPSIQHKSDVGGVKLGLADADAIAAAYDDLAARLGPKVSVAPMVPKGVELAFGMVRDPQFGPIVMVGAGGVLVETSDDRCFALPPFGVDDAKRIIGRLKLSRLLDGVRGAPPADRDALAQALGRFSVLAAALGDVAVEIDVNPVIASEHGAVAVDALVVKG